MTVADARLPLRVELQIVADKADVPNDADWEAWVRTALAVSGHPVFGVVTVRLVTEDESATLNLAYRDKPGSTNVLAFPGPGDELPGAPGKGSSTDEAVVGDLIICLPVACREAGEQGKRPVAHLAHLVVHGTLHLIGYDHQHETDAAYMESLEIRILDDLGFVDPYANPEQMSDS
jgi:probable rRNA maturation factor